MKFIRIVVIIGSILLALALLLSNISYFFSPKDFWPFAFFGLAFPFLFLGNFVLLVYWTIKKEKQGFVILVVIVFSLFQLPAFIQLHAKKSPEVDKENLVNVLSFNTHYMGAFDSKGGDSAYFFKVLDSISPDVICLQEFIDLGVVKRKFLFKQFFEKYKNYASVNADALSKTFPTGYGACIFSKYPIVKKGFLELENQNGNLTVFADIVIRGDTIRVVNTHLKSIVFDKEDYKTFEELKDPEESPDTYKLRRIFAKLKYAFQNRAIQADKVKERLALTPYKVILCGDFNDSPASYAYHTIRGKMKDAFIESGFGMSRTYIGRMPSFRIDYILHSNSWNSYNYKTTELNFSDHKMISCTIAIP